MVVRSSRRKTRRRARRKTARTRAAATRAAPKHRRRRIEMMLFAWVLCAAQAPQVSGLHAGESVSVVDPSVIPAKDERHLLLRPRVLDAFTGVPVEGVRIETWSENGLPPSCA